MSSILSTPVLFIFSFVVTDQSQSNKMAPITKQNLIHRPGSPDQSRFVFNTMQVWGLQRIVIIYYEFMQVWIYIPNYLIF